jgi:hypothetical protein
LKQSLHILLHHFKRVFPTDRKLMAPGKEEVSDAVLGSSVGGTRTVSDWLQAVLEAGLL